MPQDIINLKFIHISKKAIRLPHTLSNSYSQKTMPPWFSESAADFVKFDVKMDLREYHQICHISDYTLFKYRRSWSSNPRTNMLLRFSNWYHNLSWWKVKYRQGVRNTESIISSEERSIEVWWKHTKMDSLMNPSYEKFSTLPNTAEFLM